MKICFFNRSYWPDQAATGQLLTELAEDLVARHGCDVTVVAGRALRAPRGAAGRQYRAVTRETRAGVTILRANGTRFGPARFAGRAANYLTYFASAFAATLQSGQQDIVVSLTDPPILGLAALSAARRFRGAPGVVRVRTTKTQGQDRGLVGQRALHCTQYA